MSKTLLILIGIACAVITAAFFLTQVPAQKADSYLNRGLAYKAKGEYEPAAKDLIRAFRINPNDKRALIALKEVGEIAKRENAESFLKYGIKYAEAQQFAEAIMFFNKAIECDRDYAEAYLRRGFVLESKGSDDEAIKDYIKAVTINPGDKTLLNGSKNESEFFFGRGIKYEDGDYANKERAIRYFTEALKFAPGYLEAYLKRGFLCQSKGRYNEAIEDYTKALKIVPNDMEVHVNRGNAYSANEEYDQAIKDFNDALKINPENYFIYNDLGLAYRGKKEYDQAIDYFNKAVEADLNGSSSRFNRAYTYFEMGKYDMAITDFNKIAEIDSSYFGQSEMLTRGQAYFNIGNYDKAIEDFTEVINHPNDGTHFNAKYNRGLAYAKKGERDKAIEDLKDVLWIYEYKESAEFALKQLGVPEKEIEKAKQK